MSLPRVKLGIPSSITLQDNSYPFIPTLCVSDEMTVTERGKRDGQGLRCESERTAQIV